MLMSKHYVRGVIIVWILLLSYLVSPTSTITRPAFAAPEPGPVGNTTVCDHTGTISVICGGGDSTTNRLSVHWDIPEEWGPTSCNVYFYVGSTAYNVQGRDTPGNPCSGDALFSTYPGSNPPEPIDQNGTYTLWVSNGVTDTRDPKYCGDGVAQLPAVTVNCPNNKPAQPQTDYFWNHVIPGLTCVTEDGVASINCVPVVVKIIINDALIFLGTVAVIMILYAGYKFVTSRGDTKQVESARKIITYAIIGMIIVLLSFFILNFLSTITGDACLNQLSFHCGY